MSLAQFQAPAASIMAKLTQSVEGMTMAVDSLRDTARAQDVLMEEITKEAKTMSQSMEVDDPPAASGAASSQSPAPGQLWKPASPTYNSMEELTTDFKKKVGYALCEDKGKGNLIYEIRPPGCPRRR